MSVSTSFAYGWVLVFCVNSCPFEFSPITYIPCDFPSVSFFLDMYVEFPPAAICFAFDTIYPEVFLVYIAVVLSVEFPSPSWELVELPADSTFPPSVNITEWFVPAAISFIPLTDTICCGNVCVALSPVPNCPELLYPVAHTFPFTSNIIAWFAPAATWMIFEIFFIFTGYVIGSVDLFACPSSPSSLLPHPYTSPSDVTA